MRELSEQEIEAVSGGVADFSVVFRGSSTAIVGESIDPLQIPKLVMPRLNLVDDHIFKNYPDS